MIFAANLLPWREEAQRIKKRRVFFYALLTAGTFLLFCVGNQLYWDHLIRQQVQKNHRLELQVQELHHTTQQVTRLIGQQKEIVQRTQIIHSWFNSKSVVSNVLTVLNRTLPQDIQLTQLTYRGDTIGLHGETKSPPAIFEFLKQVNRQKGIINPTLKQAEKDMKPHRKLHQFTLYFTLMDKGDVQETSSHLKKMSSL